MTDIIVALITGGLALIGVIISNLVATSRTNKSVSQTIATSQAVTDVKIEELTREVREHNNFAQRVPTLEREMKDTKADVKRLEEYIMKR